MDISKRFSDIGEYLAAGMYEEPERSLFYRKALGLRIYFETCNLHSYNGELLYPSGTKIETNIVVPWIGEDVWIFLLPQAQRRYEKNDYREVVTSIII